MKLLRLKLGTAFRSLPAGFEVQFLSEQDHKRCFDFQPYCLAGLNGSGKSNLLEALAAIFYHLECIYLDYRPDGFQYDKENDIDGFKTEVCNPDVFELEYLFPIEEQAKGIPVWVVNGRPVVHICITKENGVRPIAKFVAPVTDTD